MIVMSLGDFLLWAKSAPRIWVLQISYKMLSNNMHFYMIINIIKIDLPTQNDEAAIILYKKNIYKILEQKMKNIKKVFLSYAKEDYDIAKKLYNDLKCCGIPAWIDREHLLPGQNWKISIEKAINECCFFIVLLSSNSVSKKGFIQNELKISLDMLKSIPPNEIFIIPVRIDDCTPSDERLKYIHWADLFPQYNKGFKKIVQVLASDNDIQLDKEYLKNMDTNDITDSSNRLVQYPSIDELSVHLSNCNKLDVILAGGDVFFSHISEALRKEDVYTSSKKLNLLRVLLRRSSTAAPRSFKKYKALEEKLELKVDVRWYDNDFMLRGYCFDDRYGFFSFFLRENEKLTGRINNFLFIDSDGNEIDKFLVNMFTRTFNSFFKMHNSQNFNIDKTDDFFMEP